MFFGFFSLYCIRYPKVLSQKKICQAYFIKIGLTGTESLLVQSTKNNVTNENVMISKLSSTQKQQITPCEIIS